jgi:succinoglycan biosynthesis protein ExoM
MNRTKQAMADPPHICICICTFKRAAQLGRLLQRLDDLITEDRFEYSVVVVDNDADGSAEATMLEWAQRSRVVVSYYLEPEQNISLARNRAVRAAKGDYLAFIDDDELPASDWLINLYKAILRFGSEGVLGPVLPHFEVEPPKWVRESGIFERPRHTTGHVLDSRHTRTGNVLFKESIFDEDPTWFRREFGSGGEDRDFFRRQIAKGHKFIWCDEAPVYEFVPRERWELGFLIKRALLRGKMALNAATSKPRVMLVSLGALAVYGLSLPLLLAGSPLIGFGFFVKYMIRYFDHFGKLLALLHINLIKEKYIVAAS